ncbi:glycerol-3-phosphate dehydrogenase/oxidase [Halosimplex aquaticum]|uniref:Glycerol-3-phosphate dehydrogenase n=1 Tax=Halosimplex aquaticum TaxID=3026162 RepID=A0ABD5Y5Z6_9EURY|nr:glycerol-3-phosphate dehydrogenase/oxidase [Halosimplex aquaticum]
MSDRVSSTDRAKTLDRVREAEYDVAVVGGGVAGAGVARDAAMRGLDVVLVEASDFGSGTTAYSTRLVHGGLRYLKQYDFGLVFESPRERETLAEIAPHLVDPLRFLIPQYDESWSYRFKLRLGMALYDALSYGKTVPNHERLSRSRLRDTEPALPETGLQGGFAYYDRQAEFVERLCLETVMDADANGADVLNHASAESVETDGDSVAGLTVEDGLTEETFDIESSAVVNAAGPWAEEVAAGLPDDTFVRPAKGIHVVVPRLTDDAVTLPTTDGRVVFVVPWNGKSLVGTTDTDYDGDPREAHATASDVEYLLDEVGRFFPGLNESDVLYAYAGVRPLYDTGGASDSAAVSRDHEVVEHGYPYAGLFSLVGAKITPYRAAAEDATDAVTEYLGVDSSCRTAEEPLPGGRGEPSLEGELPTATADHLASLYGSRATVIERRAAADPRLAEPLCEHTDDILAQVTVAVEEEYARRLTDVLFMRCTVGFEPCEGRDAVETVADHMATLLGWDETRTREEIDRYETVIDRRHVFEDDYGTRISM